MGRGLQRGPGSTGSSRSRSLNFKASLGLGKEPAPHEWMRLPLTLGSWWYSHSPRARILPGALRVLWTRELRLRAPRVGASLCHLTVRSRQQDREMGPRGAIPVSLSHLRVQGEDAGHCPLGARPRRPGAPHPRASWGSVPSACGRAPAASGLGWCGTDRTVPPLSTETPPDYQFGRSRAA